MSHTPGPWEVFDHAPWSVWHGNTQIATCRVMEVDSHKIRGRKKDRIAPFFEVDPETTHANALLIAAAPELLTALKRMRDLIRDNPDVRVEAKGLDAFEKAAAAIAKAEGR